ncbi:DUF5677 domain-containing protein [Kribbella soli]|uniref:Uncharacterized protein n=1 Tax=Kribbella soli TaxID=1124743 RepID=A0A4R0HLY3_9ACTN|nr:DUF5677 domain-containing protein [Kribbella soli]TCC10894.1 hypothetical protein E0H45_06215 [Kribbella soli]
MRQSSKPLDFDESYYESMRDAVERLIAKGMSPEEAIDAAAEVSGEVLNGMGPSVAATLIRTSPRMLREHRIRAGRFERHLQRYWGKALDLFYSILVCAEEAGREFDERNSPATREAGDDVFEVLTGLHARAIRTAGEVYALLTQGFPLGALARCRTLHELAVTAVVIAEFGRMPEYPDLAQRFISHRVIARVADAEVYQTNAAALGEDPFSEEQMNAWRSEREALISQYGTDFKKDYGWAIPLFGFAPNFRQLEERAGLDHLRGYYRWASHEVHSGSRGWSLNTFERVDGSLYRLTGRTIEGFTEPGTMAITSLVQTMTFLLTSGNDEALSPRDLVGCTAVKLLAERCDEAFLAAETEVAEWIERRDARGSGRFSGPALRVAGKARARVERIASGLPRPRLW